MPSKAALIWLVASLIFVALGVLCLAAVITDWREYRRTASWVPVDASIDSLGLEWNSGTGKHGSYDLNCRYTYIVSGTEYHGTRVGIINGGVSGNEINGPRYFKILEKPWKDHASVTAWVNPADANESLLIREFSGRLYGLFAAGLLFGGFPVACWWIYVRLRVRRKLTG